MNTDGSAGRRREPILNAPPVIVWLVGLLVAVHLVRQVLPEEVDDAWVLSLAFIPARYSTAANDLTGAPWASVTSFLTHAFVHGSFTHLMINGAWLLAVGSPLARRMTTSGFLAYAGLCGIAGAAAFLVLDWGLEAPMVGASGAISGLMAGVFRLLYAADGPSGFALLREHPEHAPCLSLGATWFNRPAMTAIVLWVVLNFVLAFALSDLAGGGGVAWQAHLGGFLAGLLTLRWFDRGPVAGKAT